MTKLHWDWTELLNRLALWTDSMHCTYFLKMVSVLVRTLTRHELWHLGCSQCGTLIDLGALLTSWTKKKVLVFKMQNFFLRALWSYRTTSYRVLLELTWAPSLKNIKVMYHRLSSSPRLLFIWGHCKLTTGHIYSRFYYLLKCLYSCGFIIVQLLLRT